MVDDVCVLGVTGIIALVAIVGMVLGLKFGIRFNRESAELLSEPGGTTKKAPVEHQGLST